jgi:adenylate cyclase
VARDHRRLAAIVSLDVAGYSRLMGVDDSGTLAALKAHRRELIDPKIAEHDGRIVKTTGDGLLLEFPSVVDAVRCAVDVQRGMAERNAGIAPDQRLDFRIGINVGDIIIDGDDIFGDGVNVAARLEGLADPGGICVSRVVRDQVLDKLSFAFEDLGAQEVKNIARPVEVYRVDLGSAALPTPSRGRRRWQPMMRDSRWWIAAGVLALGLVGIAVLAPPRLLKTAPAASPPPLSIAILPFAAPAGNPADKQFADAFTEDLTTALGRTRAIEVVSHGTAATYKEKAIDARAIGRELNVRYLVEGDIRRDGALIAVNAQLIDTGKATQAWSGHLELEEARVTQDQGGVLARLTRQLYDALWAADTARADKPPASNASAVDLALRANYLWAKDPDRLRGALQARELYDRALRLDPNLVWALNGKAQTLSEELSLDPHADHDGLLRQIDDLTVRAVSIDDQDPRVWTGRARALAWRWRWQAALEANARALSLDPTRDGAVAERAEFMLLMGKPTETLALVDKALALTSAAGAVARVLGDRCHAYLNLGRYDDAISACEKSAALDDWWMPHLFLVAAYTQKGDTAKAEAERITLVRQRPKVSIADLAGPRVSNDPTYLQQTDTHLFAGLRKAGIPEN